MLLEILWQFYDQQRENSEFFPLSSHWVEHAQFLDGSAEEVYSLERPPDVFDTASSSNGLSFFPVSENSRIRPRNNFSYAKEKLG